MFVGVPAMYRMLDEAGAEDRDLTSVRVWASGADAMPPELAERFKKMGATITVPLLGALGQAAFAEGYGMVEVGGGVAAKFSPPFIGAGSGPVRRRARLRATWLRDARRRRGRHRGPRAAPVGELQVKGPGVLKAYWGDEDGQRRRCSPTTAGCAPATWPGRDRSGCSCSRAGQARHQARRLLRVRPRGGAGARAAPGRAGGGRGGAARRAPRRGAGGRCAAAQGATLLSARRRHGVGRRAPGGLQGAEALRAVDELPRTGTNKVQKAELLALFE